jgi:hypothetical protein
MAKQKMKELAERLTLLKKQADRDLSLVPPKSLPGHESKKREAQDELRRLLPDYESELTSRWGAIFLSGPLDAQREFAKRAESVGPAVSVDVTHFWKKLADPVLDVAAADKLWGPNQFSALLFSFAQVSRDLDIPRMASLQYKDGVLLKTKDQLADHVRNVVRDADQDRTTEVFLKKAAVDAAVEQSYQRNILPVVVIGCLADEMQTLSKTFGGRSVKVELVEDMTESQFNDALEVGFTSLKTCYKKAS